MSSTKDALKSAVRELRTSLSLSQTAFGQLIGKSLPTIQRYESLVPPRGSSLAQFARLANEKGRADLARLFDAALSEELGNETKPPSSEEALWVGALNEVKSAAPSDFAAIIKKMADTIEGLPDLSEGDPVRFNRLERLLVLLRQSLIEPPATTEDLSEESYKKYLQQRREAAAGTQFEASLAVSGIKPPRKTKKGRAK